MCVTIIAFVFFVIFFSISSILTFQFSRSQSIKTGFACCLITASAFEIIVKFGIKTSSSFLIPSAFTAISRAAVPFATVIEYFLSTNFENSLSHPH